METNIPGINIFAGLPPDPTKGIGQVFWVGNSTTPVPGGVTGVDAAGSAGDAKHPFATIDYAYSQCTASRNDVVYVLPGHSETYTTAADLALDIAGVRIIGLGNGRNRPSIAVDATAATIAITAANVSMENFFIDQTGVDAQTQMFDVGAADFVLKDCEILMADSGGQATECIVTDASSSRMKVINCTFRSTNAGANNAISIEGTPDGIEVIGCHIYGDFADACIHNPTGNVATNLKIHDNYLQNDNNGNHAIELVSACTGEIRGNHLVTDAIATAGDFGACVNADNWYSDDGATDAAAVPFPETVTTGGSTISQVADRLGADADTDAIGALLSGSAGIATIPAAAVPANGVNAFELLREIWAVLNGTAANENGVQTFPSSAAPANNVSLAEVIRSLYDAVAHDSAATTTVQTGLGRRVTKVGDLSSAPDDLFAVTGKCLITLMVGEVTSALATTTSILLMTSTNSVTIANTTDVLNDVVGTLYLVTGDPDDTLNGDVTTVPNVDVAWSQTGFHAPFMINDDNIYMSVGGAGTGKIQWDLFYIPLEASASIASSA